MNLTSWHTLNIFFIKVGIPWRHHLFYLHLLPDFQKVGIGWMNRIGPVVLEEKILKSNWTSSSGGEDFEIQIGPVVQKEKNFCCCCCNFVIISLGTSRPILWNKNLRSLCVSAGRMYKLSVEYIYIFNEQLIIYMTL